MKSVVMESISGLMANNMKVSGVKIKCMVKVLSYGKIKRNIKVNLSMISVRVLVLSAGPMVDNTLENGKQENNMDMVLTSVSKGRRNLVSGKTERK